MDLNRTTPTGDTFFDYLAKIQEEYSALKRELSTARIRIQQLEAENEQLKLSNSSANCSISEETVSAGDQKRRKTDSFDRLLQVSINDEVDVSSGLNSAIYHDPDNNTDDDEIISATPQPMLQIVKKERPKKRTERPDETTKPPIAAIKISPPKIFELPAHNFPEISFSEVPELKQKTAEETSPLRRIENNIARPSLVKPSQSFEKSAQWLSSRTPSSKKTNLFVGAVMDDSMLARPVVVSPSRNEKSPPRKSLSLSLNKQKALKQSTLKFVHPSIVKSEKSSENLLADMDETYCNELMLPKKIVLSTSKQSMDKENNNRLFRFPSKSLTFEPLHNVKQEPMSQATDRTAAKLPLAFESSSVFEVPNATDDIICLDDSQPIMASSHDLVEQMPMKSSEPVPTDNQQIPARTKRDTSARPGYMCPDCADWYKLIGPGLSDREIQRRLNTCSRHRKNMDLQETPDGFWVPFFEPTQELDVPSFQYRLKSRQQLLSDTQDY